MQNLYLILTILIGISNVKADEIIISDKFDLWTKDGYHKVDWYDMSEEQKAFALERYKSNIDYSLQNIGKKFSEVDMSKVGSDKGYKNIAPFVTYGLVGFKYQDDYYHFPKAAKYFYKDWVEFKKCENERYRGARKDDCFIFGSGPGDYNPLAAAIYQWEEAGMYNEALKHYQEYFDNKFLGRYFNVKIKDRRAYLKEELKSNSRLKEDYDGFLREWKHTKKLAKTEKPKPLDPAVQNHEWFYSNKQEEVLKALDYYYQHKVKFMLEKAAKHKDKVIVDKAKEYLEKLKDKTDNNEKK